MFWCKTQGRPRKVALLSIPLLAFLFVAAPSDVGAVDFIRGDINGNGKATITDAAQLFCWLTGSLPCEPTCKDAADVNDDGSINIVDGVHILYHAFQLGGPPPAAPFPACGTDVTEGDPYDCVAHAWCP